MKPVLFSVIVTTLLCSLAACSGTDSGSSGSEDSRPNILLIVVDDMGHSNPEKLREMLALWEQYTTENNFIYPDTLLPVTEGSSDLIRGF